MIDIPFATRRGWNNEADRRIGENRLLNEALFERLASSAPVLSQAAADTVNEYTRARMGLSPR